MDYAGWRLHVVLAVTLVLAGFSSGPAHAGPDQTRVTMITDSVGGALFWATDAQRELGEGLDFRLETKTCRKLAATGCFAYDEVPPSALDTIRVLGRELGPIVVIDVGYNDRAEEYPDALDRVMGALVDAGVEHVIWVTLEETIGVWHEINGAITAAVGRWPQLRVADWATHAADKPWLVDGPHLNHEGAVGLARFLRSIILDTCGQPCVEVDTEAPTPTVQPLRIGRAQLPDAYAGRPYAVRLAPSGGTAPFRWSRQKPFPPWLSISNTGRIAGLPPRSIGVSVARVQVRDANGAVYTSSLRIRLRPASTFPSVSVAPAGRPAPALLQPGLRFDPT